jgi:hypothetical protein
LMFETPTRPKTGERLRSIGELNGSG